MVYFQSEQPGWIDLENVTDIVTLKLKQNILGFNIDNKRYMGG